MPLVWFTMGVLVLMIIEFKYHGVATVPAKNLPAIIRPIYYFTLIMGWPIILWVWAFGSLERAIERWLQ